MAGVSLASRFRFRRRSPALIVFLDFVASWTNYFLPWVMYCVVRHDEALPPGARHRPTAVRSPDVREHPRPPQPAHDLAAELDRLLAARDGRPSRDRLRPRATLDRDRASSRASSAKSDHVTRARCSRRRNQCRGRLYERRRLWGLHRQSGCRRGRSVRTRGRGGTRGGPTSTARVTASTRSPRSSESRRRSVTRQRQRQ